MDHDEEFQPLEFFGKSMVNNIAGLFELHWFRCNVKSLGVLLRMTRRYFGVVWRDCDDFLKAIGTLKMKQCTNGPKLSFLEILIKSVEKVVVASITTIYMIIFVNQKSKERFLHLSNTRRSQLILLLNSWQTFLIWNLEIRSDFRKRKFLKISFAKSHATKRRDELWRFEKFRQFPNSLKLRKWLKFLKFPKFQNFWKFPKFWKCLKFLKFPKFPSLII